MDNDLIEGLSDAEHEKVVDHVNASFLRDRQRWDDGYIAHNSENLRKRVLAHQASTNGHSNGNGVVSTVDWPK